MTLLSRTLVFTGLMVAVLAASAANATAQDSTEDRLRALEERLRQQDDEIQRLRTQLDAQETATDSVASELDSYLSKVEDTNAWQEPGTFRVFWKNGLNLATADGAFKLKFGGRIMNDWSWMSADSSLENMFPKLGDSSLNFTEFRRARLYLSGSIYDVVEFKAQYDFAGGDADFKDMWLGLKGLPVVGHLRVGHAKVAMGLETLTSSKYITFMERSGTTALLPERKTGFFIFNTELDKRLHWAASYYTPGSNDYGNGPINNGVSARVAGTPWYEKSDGQVNLLHLGVSTAYEDSGKDGEFELDARPPSHTSPIKPIDLSIEASSRWILAGELAVVYGPFSFQAEYVVQDYDVKQGSDPSFNAYYLYASWFITGEQRNYKQDYAAFDRVTPLANFLNGEGGAGAWELALRYGATSLDDKDYHGGEMNNWTVGLNWYLNPNMRVMFNYFWSDIKQKSELEGTSYLTSENGNLNGFMMRFQIDF